MYQVQPPLVVPGTCNAICTWYINLRLYLVQIPLFVPGTITKPPPLLPIKKSQAPQPAPDPKKIYSASLLPQPIPIEPSPKWVPMTGPK
jgi:hypothetical protein